MLKMTGKLFLVRTFSTKPVLSPLPRTYSARFVESRWYDWWIAQGYFKPERSGDAPSKDHFSIILPPPNVTGSLHLGHALTIAVEDALVRWHRMHGSRVLWVPGLDHAGIATQVQVEKKLWNDKKLTRHQIGREQFLRLANVWKEEKALKITKQIRRLGAVVDWDRTVFTLDEKVQFGVREAFIRLYEKGKIYRQERLVNWCSQLNSTISDIEVEHKEILEPTAIQVPGETEPVEVGYLSYFAYPIADSAQREEIVVATTRLETILGDAAVAVHPDDNRYAHLHGRSVRHPILGTILPIICDSSVKPGFGTGAVKITPAHDYTDFDFGTRHNLSSIRVIGDNGKLLSDLPQLHGLSRFTARKTIEVLLTEKNLWRGKRAHPTVIPLCSRSGDIIEPQLKKQWFVDCKEYAQNAAVAVTSGKLKLVPDGFDKIWQLKLADDRDWCISRQLWWGQKIPAYYTVISGRKEWIAGHSKEEAAAKLTFRLGVPVKTVDISQDPDVLDTWFTSSALPFLALGWPEKTADLQQHYPLSLMETGHDILFFWVARMAILGLALTDQLPFTKVLLHGLVCDKHGKKMSKSKGNVIDPMEIVCDLTPLGVSLVAPEKQAGKSVHEIGADALRFALCRHETQQHFVSVDLEQIDTANKFCNKIWQAFHLCDGVWKQHPVLEDAQFVEMMSLPGYEMEQWVLESLKDLIITSDKAIKDFKLDVAAENLFTFWYEKFCDVYLECAKQKLKDSTDAQRCQAISTTMFIVIHAYLRLLSLYMPNLAEELYQRLPVEQAESVCVSKFPCADEILLPSTDLEDGMNVVLEISRVVRSIRAQYGLLKERPPLFIVCGPSLQMKLRTFLEPLAVISRSARCELVGEDFSTAGCAVHPFGSGVKVCVRLTDSLDVDKELERYDGQLLKLNAKLDEAEEKKLKENFDKRSDRFKASVEETISGVKLKIDEIVQIRNSIGSLKS